MAAVTPPSGIVNNSLNQETSSRLFNDRDQFKMLLASLPDHGKDWFDMTGIHLLPGPHLNKDKYPGKLEALEEFSRHNKQGKNIIYLESLAIEYAGDSAVNLVIPIIVFSRKPYIDDIIVVANPNDAERVARLHVKKSTVYGDNANFLGDGVLSTRNLDSWHEQRTTLAEGFLPLAALAKVMPVSVRRAEYAISNKLNSLASAGKPVEVWEFFLYEAMAQLHLALFGETEQFSEQNNVKLRSAFNTMFQGVAVGVEKWKAERDFIRSFSKQVLDHTKNEKGDPVRAAPYRSAMTGCPVMGPVAAKLSENIPQNAVDPVSIQRDTATTLSFAGFDTTANLMTWVTFEMCRRPELQKRLQQEVDTVYDELQGRELIYSDLSKFPFLTKVINETLRLWTSVPSGTFREIQYDEIISGPNGEKIELKPGTQIWIPSWLLHRSEKLWGKDVLEFNPDREWLPEESWYGKSFGGTNPASHRYCPFTYPPRGCLGLNFAQMESRVILSRMFREFDFSFAEPTKSMAANAHTREHFLGSNRGTMGPEGGLHVNVKPRRATQARM